MPFLTLSNANVQFGENKLEWRSYTTAQPLPTTKRVELIERREFATAALDKNVETFVVHIATLSTTPTMQVHPSHQAQVGLLLTDKAPVKVLPKYLNYADVFSFDLAIELPENTGTNEYAIELIEDK